MTKTTIQVEKSLVNMLKETREYPRQPYGELIINMVKTFRKVKQKNQYDEFMHKIQQSKMKELWDNKDDEVWENV